MYSLTFWHDYCWRKFRCCCCCNFKQLSTTSSIFTSSSSSSSSSSILSLKLKLKLNKLLNYKTSSLIIIMIILILNQLMINNVYCLNQNNQNNNLFMIKTTPVIDIYHNNNNNNNNNNYRIQHHYPHHHHQQQQSIARINFENAYKELINNDLRTIFLRQHYNFDLFFRNILTISHADFHRMFSDTYGILYDRHSYIFNEMFHNLENYYNNGKIDLQKTMLDFFNKLYKKIFEELNTQYSFDELYLNCTVEHMEEMMPFGELPKKLIIQIRRSFIAIRTFIQSLQYGSDILKTIMELPISTSCENHLKLLSYCYHCSNNNNNNNICEQTCIKRLEKYCLYNNNDNNNNNNNNLNLLNKEWNKFINDIIRLASRLKTSFNIEHIVSPIHIQISDAIMNFQENGRTISQRLFNKCGRPIHRKVKRNDYYQQQQQQHSINVGNSYQSSNPMMIRKQHQHQQQQQNIDSIIDSMTNEFKTFKNFWSNLPKKLCSHYSININCISNQTFRNIDEQNFRDRNNIEIINQQISTLRLISFNMNKAYNGLDVDFENNFDQDNEPPIDDELSDDGSGESSGDNNNNNNNDDDDDNDNDDGSGFIDSQSMFNNDNNNENLINNRQNSSNNDIHFNNELRTTTTTTPTTATPLTTTTKIITLDVTKTSSSSPSRTIFNQLLIISMIIIFTIN